MKTRFILAAALALSGQMALAQSAEEQVTDNLQDLGFRGIEVTVTDGQLIVVGTRRGRSLEVVWDAETGAVLSQTWVEADDEDATAGERRLPRFLRAALDDDAEAAEGEDPGTAAGDRPRFARSDRGPRGHRHGPRGPRPDNGDTSDDTGDDTGDDIGDDTSGDEGDGSDES